MYRETPGKIVDIRPSPPWIQDFGLQANILNVQSASSRVEP
jgi:hypothetical protein